MAEVIPGPGAAAPPDGLRARAAVFLDYQNLHHYLKNRGGVAPADAAIELLAAIRDRLAGDGARLSTGYAYADFGGLDEHTRHVQRALYLHGVQPVYVPSTVHRNTTDLQLAVDALALRDREPGVTTFVLVAGDRDYVPVVQALQAAGRRVIVVAFRDHLSGHLLTYTQAGAFVDAEGLLPEAVRAQLAAATPAAAGAVEERARFNDVRRVPHPLDLDALAVLERHFGRYEEVYLTPLLRKLSEEIGDVDGRDPKGLVAELEAVGAVRLERRKGMPYDYTVLLVNRDHPDVAATREEVQGEAPATGSALDDDGFDYDDDEYEYEDDGGALDDELEDEAPAEDASPRA